MLRLAEVATFTRVLDAPREGDLARIEALDVWVAVMGLSVASPKVGVSPRNTLNRKVHRLYENL